MKILTQCLTILISLVISACSSKPIIKTEIVKPVVVKQQISPILLSPINFKILTNKSLSCDKDFLYYGLDIDNFEILRNNLSGMRMYIENQKSVINYYERQVLDEAK